MNVEQSKKRTKQIAELEEHAKANPESWFSWDKRAIDELKWKYPWQLNSYDELALNSLYQKLQILRKLSGSLKYLKPAIDN